jgi:hypothetical protein
VVSPQIKSEEESQRAKRGRTILREGGGDLRRCYDRGQRESVSCELQGTE